MKYQLIEKYFQTELFQIAVQEYFDTVLGKLVAENTLLPAKGLFEVNGEIKRDYYDMPYHIHILNGLIPALFVYEKILSENGWIEDAHADTYVRIFILGFTFHDANKLLQTQQTAERSDLEIAVANLDDHVHKWEVKNYFSDFDQHKSTINYLALITEYGTGVTAEEYPITVNNRRHIKEIQGVLCHLADSLASIQNESLETIEALFKTVQKSLNNIRSIVDLSISYVKVRSNPYTLLSQNLLQVAKKTLHRAGKKVLYATHEGFIFWGEDVTEEEFWEIEKNYLKGSEEDIKFLELTKITAQKCKFGFLGSITFTQDILREIVTELDYQFLALSPNSNTKITDFEEFVAFTRQLISSYQLPVDYSDKDGKLTLSFLKNMEDEDDLIFRRIYNLGKIKWLNSKENKKWKNDFDGWVNSQAPLPEAIKFETEKGLVILKTIPELLEFLAIKVKSTSSLFKTYLNFIKTYNIIETAEDLETVTSEFEEEIISTFSPTETNHNPKQDLFNQYFECLGKANLQFLESYNPEIPLKKEMCAFTGASATIDYKAEVAFAMKARGFSNRTITSLNNTTSHISALFAEENKLRASLFKVGDANLVMYNDLFEAKLDIDREIILACVQAKNELTLLESGTIEFDKKARFHYNLYNLEFVKLQPKVEPTFFFVRKCLRMAQHMGIRSYVAGIMTPYYPHKAVFHFENAPRFLKLLGWDSIRLQEVDAVIDEMKLVLAFGKNRIESNLLKIAKSRLAYFTLYYFLNASDKGKVYNSLITFYKKYKHKFFAMTVTEKLVELAVEIDIGFKSSAEETWLIRTSLDYLRKYHKQGSEREDIIQKTCGEIFRKMRMKHPDMDAIRAFATAIYDELFLKDWKGKIPTVNVEKDWIYQFAFLFRERSLEIVRTKRAKGVKTSLEKEDKPINLENVKSLLPKEMKRNAEQYLRIIQKIK